MVHRERPAGDPGSADPGGRRRLADLRAYEGSARARPDRTIRSAAVHFGGAFRGPRR